MRILHVLPAYIPSEAYGGPTTVARQHATALHARGHEVTVATTNLLALDPWDTVPAGLRQVEGVDVHYFPVELAKSYVPARALLLRTVIKSQALNRFPFLRSKMLVRWVAEHADDFDIVHIHFSRDHVIRAATKAALKSDTPCVLQPHGMLGRTDGIRSLIDVASTRRLLTTARAVLCLQDHERSEVAEIAPEARLLTLPNGIEPVPHAPTWSIENLDQPVILFLARLQERKRVLHFVRMASLLRDRGIRCRYRIVGPDGGERGPAIAEVSRLNLDGDVEFVGGLGPDAAREEYAKATIYVLPSINEPFAMTILEALSVGTPTVVTTSCFNRTVLDGAVAVAEPPAEALADAVEALLNDRCQAVALSGAGKRITQGALNLACVIDALEASYRSCAVSASRRQRSAVQSSE